MYMKTNIIIGLAALVSSVSSPALAEDTGNGEPETIQEIDEGFQSFLVPCMSKVSEDCTELPNVPSLKAETLRCLHFVDSQFSENGLIPVSEEDREYAEECLELFTTGLLG